jgi:hypothetical protein
VKPSCGLFSSATSRATKAAFLAGAAGTIERAHPVILVEIGECHHDRPLDEVLAAVVLRLRRV